MQASVAAYQIRKRRDSQSPRSQRSFGSPNRSKSDPFGLQSSPKGVLYDLGEDDDELTEAQSIVREIPQQSFEEAPKRSLTDVNSDLKQNAWLTPNQDIIVTAERHTEMDATFGDIQAAQPNLQSQDSGPHLIIETDEEYEKEMRAASSMNQAIDQDHHNAVANQSPFDSQWNYEGKRRAPYPPKMQVKYLGKQVDPEQALYHQQMANMDFHQQKQQLLINAQRGIRQDVNKILESKNKFYQVLNHQVQQKNADIQDDLARRIINDQSHQELMQKDTYLSKKYAEFYSVMLSDGSRQISDPNQPKQETLLSDLQKQSEQRKQPNQPMTIDQAFDRALKPQIERSSHDSGSKAPVYMQEPLYGRVGNPAQSYKPLQGYLYHDPRHFQREDYGAEEAIAPSDQRTAPRSQPRMFNYYDNRVKNNRMAGSYAQELQNQAVNQIKGTTVIIQHQPQPQIMSNSLLQPKSRTYV